MGALSPTHWLTIVVVLVVLFGAKRLPDAARSLGRSARILKAEVAQAGADGTLAESPQTTPTAVSAPTAVSTPTAVSAPAQGPAAAPAATPSAAQPSA